MKIRPTRINSRFTGATIACVFFALATTQSTDAYQSATPDVSPQMQVQTMQLMALEAKVNSTQVQIEQLTERRTQSEKRMREMLAHREQLSAQQDEIGVSPESFPEIMKTLQSQRVQLIIDLAGLDARREALQAARENLVETSRPVEVIEALEQMLELKNNLHEQAIALRERGLGSPGDVFDAQIEILSTKITLADAKSTNSSTGSPRLDEELLDASLDRAEKHARLAKLESLLSVISPSRIAMAEDEQAERQILSLSTQMQRLDNDIADTRAELLGWVHQLESLRAQMDMDQSDH